MRFGKISIVVVITVIATILLQKPASVIFYRIKEPRFICPIKMDTDKLVIRNDTGGDGGFGANRRNGRAHSGIDIQAPIGTPVYAAKSGIAFCGNVPTGYGKYVTVFHIDNYQTMYGHLANWGVWSTKPVRRGDVIGFVGNTGNASGRHIEPHLHFEIRKNGEPQDPQSLMKIK